MTPTRKVKRSLMHERFKPLVEAMYDDSESGCSRPRSAMR